MSFIASCRTIFLQAATGSSYRPGRLHPRLHEGDPMNAMAPPRPTELHGCQVRLAAKPAAVGQARCHVQAAIGAWAIPVDEDVAVLLTSELVTNAITHQ